jgi:hypothetical protein
MDTGGIGAQPKGVEHRHRQVSAPLRRIRAGKWARAAADTRAGPVSTANALTTWQSQDSGCHSRQLRYALRGLTPAWGTAVAVVWDGTTLVGIS